MCAALHLSHARLQSAPSTTDHLRNCFHDVRVEDFNVSQFDAQYVERFRADLHPASCLQQEPVFNRMLWFTASQVVIGLLLFNAFVSAVMLSCCKFQGVTVEGFSADDGMNFDSKYVAL